MKKSILALALALALLSGCTARQAQETPAPTATPAATPLPTAAPTAPTAERTSMRLAVINGPSGIGAVKLMADSDAGTTANEYDITVAGQNDEITAGLINGSIDAATVASNVASVLYNKTGGQVQIAAVTGLGVLYLLENGDAVQSFADLKGKTIYATGQGANPEYVLRYLLTENGVDPADVTVEWGTAEEVSARMLSGEAALCMLPVPAATAVLQKNPDVREALDFSAEWSGLKNGSQLTQTVLVVRTAFAQEQPSAVAALLAEYESSIGYVNQNAKEAGALAVEYGLAPSAAVAEAAIPKCNLTFVTGVTNLRDAVQGYYQVLWQADPKSVGGSLPDDAFYFGR